MVKRLTKTGNSLALVLDKPLLEQTHIDAETALEISTDGHVIVISPVRDEQRLALVRSLVASAEERFAGIFRVLAD